MKTISLTKGKVAIVDDDDFDKINKFKWCISGSGSRLYAHRRSGGIIEMHRQILDAPKGMVVDHINVDGLDNRKINLRVCTQSQNLCNRRILQRTNTSGKAGVYWCESQKRWIAEIKIRRKKTFIGQFINIDDAIIARRNAEKKFFGEFAPTGGT